MSFLREGFDHSNSSKGKESLKEANVPEERERFNHRLMFIPALRLQQNKQNISKVLFSPALTAAHKKNKKNNSVWASRLAVDGNKVAF